MAAAVDWREAPDDVLILVAERLPSLADRLRFGAVCRSWASAVAQSPPDPGTYLPCLVVPPPDGAGWPCDLFCLSAQKAYPGLRFAEETRDWRCFGSCHAWLAMADSDAGVHLLNPMSGARVDLPSISTIPKVIDVIEWPPGGSDEAASCQSANRRRPLMYVTDWLERDDGLPGLEPLGYDGEELRDRFMSKICMSSSDPMSDPNCVVVATYGDLLELAFCRPGNSGWTDIRPAGQCFHDAIFHNGKLYAVDYLGALAVVEGFDSGSPAVRQVAPSPRDWVRPWNYLLGLPSGELLLVSRVLDEAEDFYRTVRFLVFKLDPCCARPAWEKVKSLGDLALFVGRSSSLAIPSSRVPSGACRSNAIYFTDDYIRTVPELPRTGHDNGVFDMGSGSIQSFYPNDADLTTMSPIWIVPNPK